MTIIPEMENGFINKMDSFNARVNIKKRKNIVICTYLLEISFSVFISRNLFLFNNPRDCLIQGSNFFVTLFLFGNESKSGKLGSVLSKYGANVSGATLHRPAATPVFYLRVKSVQVQNSTFINFKLFWSWQTTTLANLKDLLQKKKIKGQGFALDLMQVQVLKGHNMSLLIIFFLLHQTNYIDYQHWLELERCEGK